MPHTLTLHCPDRPGIVAAVAAALLTAGANITQAQQFNDTATGHFFMRVVFDGGPDARQALDRLTAPHALTYTLRAQADRRRVLIALSRQDHCLVDLIYRWRIGELAMDPVGIVANHPRDTYGNADFAGLPFHHLPITGTDRPAQEARLWDLFERSGAELLVLARYMQILSQGLATRLHGRCINIHHSFLPSFRGARPYHQAHERGVKLIGATAHFVTGALDEGPIIAQDVEPVSHADTPADMIRKGRDIERRVLARAVRDYLEDRIILNGTKTIVFA